MVKQRYVDPLMKSRDVTNTRRDTRAPIRSSTRRTADERGARGFAIVPSLLHVSFLPHLCVSIYFCCTIHAMCPPSLTSPYPGFFHLTTSNRLGGHWGIGAETERSQRDELGARGDRLPFLTRCVSSVSVYLPTLATPLFLICDRRTRLHLIFFLLHVWPITDEYTEWQPSNRNLEYW